MFRFGSVEVDVRGRELLVGGTEAHLEPQAFDLLAYLIEHRDRVVPKTELLDEVWGDQFVSESALTTRIKEVRRAVGDDGRTQSVVKNVRGRGYRFVASIDDADVIDARRDAAASTLSVPTGRGAEIDQIERALDQGRVVSLVGPGGVGKTTLATAVGRRTDGAVLVDLTSVSDEAGVLPAWRQAAGLVGPVADEELSIETFAGSETLWILDNCEHVVARVAELLDLFCSVDGEGRILATTRERLGVSQELVIPIEPLTIEDARTVFLERANRVRPDFALAPDEVSDLDALLNDIDRLPLAIEMAAGRIGAMTIVDLNGAIGSSTSILRSAQRHPTSRHRSITDLVAWSEGLLSSGERAIFSGCSVFAGPVELRDAVGVLAETDDQRAVVIEALSSLVDRSLIVADVSDAATRYRMLETTKGHVRASMDDAWSARHAVWFAEEADVARRQLQTDQERQAHDRLVALLPELRIAHAWARTNDVETAVRITRSLARWSYERLRGEPARWALELLGLLPEASSAWCDVAAAIAGDAANRADFGLARDHAVRALEAAGPLGRLASLDALTNVALYEGELDAVITWGDRLMEEAVAIGDVGAMVQATVSRSMVSTYAGDPASGRAEVVAFEPPPASPLDRGWLAYSLAESLAVVDPVAAQLEYRRAMELASDVGAELLLSVSRVSLAASLARDGDRDEAIGEFRSMFEAFQRTANLTHAITALRNLTVFLARMGRDRSAMELLGSLSGDEVKSTFGAEAEDLAACRSTVEERAGRAAVEAWIAVGRLWRPREAIQAALDALP